MLFHMHTRIYASRPRGGAEPEVAYGAAHGHRTPARLPARRIPLGPLTTGTPSIAFRRSHVLFLLLTYTHRTHTVPGVSGV